MAGKKRLTPLKRLVRMPAFGTVVAAPFVLWAHLCKVTTRWQIHGAEALKADLAQGPVLMIVWHADLLLLPLHFPRHHPVVTLNDPSPIGTIAAGYYRWFGYRTMSSFRKSMPASTVRQVMRAVSSGATLGLTADGPRGPARQVTDATLTWLRLSRQLPVWTFSLAQNGGWTLRSWDRTKAPRPMTRGAVVMRRWQPEPGQPQAESLRQFLDQVAAEAEAALSNPPAKG